MRISVLSCISFILFSSAIFSQPSGDDNGWAIMTPEEKKKILDAHIGYVMPGKDGIQHKRFNEAAQLLSRRDEDCQLLVKALLAWSEIDKSDPKLGQSAKLTTISLSRIIVLQAITENNYSQKDDVVAKMPDRMIDEYMWLVRRGGNPKVALMRIADFGPRADRISEDIRQWFFATKGGEGGNKVTDGEVKVVLDRIKK